MGQVKALLPWAGTSLVGHQLRELLATRIRRAILVVGAHGAQITGQPEVRAHAAAGRVQVVTNPRWSEGKCGSIRVGVEAVAPSATDLVLLAVDQPTAAEVLEALMAEHERRAAAATLPTYGGRRGHPALLSARLGGNLRVWREGEQGLRGLIARVDAQGALVEAPVRAPWVRGDLNRPGDLAAVRERPNFTTGEDKPPSIM